MKKRDAILAILCVMVILMAMDRFVKVLVEHVPPISVGECVEISVPLGDLEVVVIENHWIKETSSVLVSLENSEPKLIAGFEISYEDLVSLSPLRIECKVFHDKASVKRPPFDIPTFIW